MGEKTAGWQTWPPCWLTACQQRLERKVIITYGHDPVCARVEPKAWGEQGGTWVRRKDKRLEIDGLKGGLDLV